MEIIIRKGVPGDEAEIASVHTHAWQETYRGLIPDKVLDDRPLSFKSRVLSWRKIVEGKDPSIALVAEHATYGIIGFCSVGPAREASRAGQGEVASIYLLNQVKGQGVGKRLFAMAQDHLRAQGMKRMYVWVLETNPSVKFYEKIGGRLTNDKRVLDFGGTKSIDSCYEWDL